MLGKPRLHIGHYIGGLQDDERGDDLHHIEISNFWSDKYVVVEIRLFANRTLPLYIIVVGERL
jgi:hypothetical protein